MLIESNFEIWKKKKILENKYDRLAVLKVVQKM